MAEADITALLREAPISFVGTVEHLGATTMATVPVDERTGVVHVDQVLHAPEAFATLGGQRVTMQFAADKDLPGVGTTAVFFVVGLALGESVAVAEVGRLPVETVEPQITAAMEAGETSAFAALQRVVDTDRIREHAAGADAVVLGRVVKLENLLGFVSSEHDPDWWRATIEVFHVERGEVAPGMLQVLYANSIDVRWRRAPKPKASQGGMWLLHSTTGDLRAEAPFVILHPEDFQPTQELDVLR
jgi:hypothetical protein